jgi:triosephosphate isomerase (TIM)
MKKTVPLIVGNWKLNPVTMNEATALVSQVIKNQKKLVGVEIAVAPSFTYLSEVGKKIKSGPVVLSAQDVSTENVGAFTGEVSVLQLKDLGVEYVIVGHSERRARGETDEVVQKKVAITLKNRLTPIVCIGERDRDEQGLFFTFVEKQIRSLANGLDSAMVKKIVIAYEPIWAIGTGNTASPDDVREMQIFIQSILAKIYDRQTASKVKILYGGSVKPSNAKEIHASGGMNGFLVGGASLNPNDFTNIIKSVL